MDTNVKGPTKRPAARGGPQGLRARYVAPSLVRLGSAAAMTNAVSKRGLKDGFMGRRTG
jgi:hypothetical protein